MPANRSDAYDSNSPFYLGPRKEDTSGLYPEKKTRPDGELTWEEFDRRLAEIFMHVPRVYWCGGTEIRPLPTSRPKPNN